eukprot:scaffold16235_cov129-Isochrysis_galbana.AAC.2
MRRQVERRVARPACDVDVGPGLHERPHARLVAVLGRHVERRVALPACDVDFGPGLQECPEARLMAILGGDVERRLALFIGGVDVGLGLQECTRARVMAVCAPAVERRQAVSVRGIEVGLRPDQCPDGPLSSLAGSDHERCVPVKPILDVGASLEQSHDARRMQRQGSAQVRNGQPSARRQEGPDAPLVSFPERRPEGLRRVDVGPGTDQGQDAPLMSGCGGGAEHSLVAVRGIDIGLRLNEREHARVVPFLRGDHQARVLRLQVGSRLKQCADARRMPQAAR